jgi:hypothetical protein
VVPWRRPPHGRSARRSVLVALALFLLSTPVFAVLLTRASGAVTVADVPAPTTTRRAAVGAPATDGPRGTPTSTAAGTARRPHPAATGGGATSSRTTVSQARAPYVSQATSSLAVAEPPAGRHDRGRQHPEGTDAHGQGHSQGNQGQGNGQGKGQGNGQGDGGDEGD